MEDFIKQLPKIVRNLIVLIVVIYKSFLDVSFKELHAHLNGRYDSDF